MKAYFAVLVVFLLTALAVFAEHQHAAKPHEMTGVVTDTMCGKTHMMPGKTNAECIRECVKSSSKYALQVGDKAFPLSGDSKKVEPFAGKKVKVTGDMKGDTMTVATIADAK